MTISPSSGLTTTAFTYSYSSTSSPPYLSMRPVGNENTQWYNIAYGGATGLTFTPSTLTSTSSGAIKPPPPGQYSLFDNISNTILVKFTIVATTISPSSGYATTAFKASYSSTSSPPYLSMRPVGNESTQWYNIAYGGATGLTFTPSTLTSTSTGAIKPPPAGQYSLFNNISNTILVKFTITATPITPTTISPSSGYATTAFTVSYSSTSTPPVLSMRPVGQSSVYYTIGTGGATGYTFTPSTITNTSSGATKPPPAGQYYLMGNTDVLLTFTILENSNKWTNVFPVGGVAISGGEADSNMVASMNGAYNIYTSSLWNSKSNLVRLPVVWGLHSKGNNENMLFTSSTYPSGSWAYNQTYLDAIVSNVTKIVNANKVVIIDMHTYMKWNSDVNLNKDQLAVIWGKVLLLFNTYPIFKNLLVWFELVNEPYSINDLSDYQSTITTIRNLGYSNKLVLGINAYNKWGHVINNGYILPNGSYEKGISSYTGGFPTDTNFCVTLHQYFNSVGSGTNYNSEPMLNPWWTTPNGNLTTEMLTISNLNNGKCDFLLGEFGYDSNYNPSNCGKNAVINLLNAMKSSNTSNNLTSTTVPDFLSKTTGKLWLGFAAWQLNANPTSFTENYISDSMYSSTYSTYFS